MKTTKWKTLLAASMAGLTLLSSAPLQAFATETQGNNSGLVMDDTSNVINGLTDAHMWSNDNGKTWTRGESGHLFKGTQKVIVANYDEQIASAQTWSAKSYAGGSLVIYKNALWTNSYWAEANQAPGSAPMWTKVKDVPAGIATFNFNKFTGAAADDYQKVQAETVQNQKKVIGYFANWQGYKTDYEPNNPDYSPTTVDGKGYDPVDVPFDKITHVNYGFMIIDPTTGKLTSKDPWADYADGGGRNYIGQINDLADENDVTSMVSIGGWNNSVEDLAFDIVTKTPEKMDEFTTDIVNFVLKHGFDGVDIDWEYPDNEDRKTKFIALMKQLREKLTVAGKASDTYYQLSIAVTASHEKMEFIAPETVNQYVDNFNVMTYDFRGGFDTETGHHSALYATETDKDKKFNVSSAMKEYSEIYNIPKNKLMVGMSYYSRGFDNVETGELGAPSEGAPIGGTWDDPKAPAGLMPWFQLKELQAKANEDPNDNLVAKWDDQAKAPYIYDADAKEFYSYDNIQSIQEKVNWTIKNEYGGAIVWELGYDTTDAELGSIVENILTEKTEVASLDIAIVRDTNLVTMRLDYDSQKTANDYRVKINDRYIFSNQNGVNYYSYKTKETEGYWNGTWSIYQGNLQLKQGDKITLDVKREGSSEFEALDQITVTDEMLPNVDERKNDVSDLKVIGKKVSVTLAKEPQEKNHHYVVTRNGDYIMSSDLGTVYYSYLDRSSDPYIWTRNLDDLKVGDKLEVYLAGDYYKTKLHSYKTITVTQEMLDAK